jgi:Ran GTPase-activating protein (RanGAP) involved in mRNA processing and transport
MASLKDLRLHSNQIGDAGVTALSYAFADACALGAMAKLESLDLHGNQIGDAGVSAFALARATGALAFAKLEKLELRGNNIDDIGVTALASACDTGALASLSELEMGNGPIGADHPNLKAACKKRRIDLC